MRDGVGGGVKRRGWSWRWSCMRRPSWVSWARTGSIGSGPLTLTALHRHATSQIVCRATHYTQLPFLPLGAYDSAYQL